MRQRVISFVLRLQVHVLDFENVDLEVAENQTVFQITPTCYTKSFAGMRHVYDSLLCGSQAAVGRRENVKRDLSAKRRRCLLVSGPNMHL